MIFQVGGVAAHPWSKIQRPRNFHSLGAFGPNCPDGKLQDSETCGDQSSYDMGAILIITYNNESRRTVPTQKLLEPNSFSFVLVICVFLQDLEPGNAWPDCAFTLRNGNLKSIFCCEDPYLIPSVISQLCHKVVELTSDKGQIWQMTASTLRVWLFCGCPYKPLIHAELNHLIELCKTWHCISSRSFNAVRIGLAYLPAVHTTNMLMKSLGVLKMGTRLTVLKIDIYASVKIVSCLQNNINLVLLKLRRPGTTENKYMRYY